MKYAVIGDPVSHSLSPVMHQVNFKSLNMEDTYEALHIPTQDFHDIRHIIEDNHINGFNVTIPHKERIILIWMKLMTKQKLLEPLIL